MIGAVGCLPLVAIVAAILFPVFAHARENARMTSSMSNLKQIGLASLQFAQDNDEKLPPTDTFEHFKGAVSPYLRGAGPQVFIEPGADVPYVVNPKVSKHSIAEFAHPETVMLAQEAVPHSTGQRAILYLDGHVKLVTDN